LSKHQKSVVHLTSSSKFHAYKQSHKIGNVHTQLNTAHKELVEKNRKYVSIIIDILKYITRQGIALRSHDESKNSNNQGRHFIKMCNIRVYCILLYIGSLGDDKLLLFQIQLMNTTKFK